MSRRAIPCLGYQSRTEAVLALRSQGLSTREIAQRVGINSGAVSSLEISATRRGRAPAPNPGSSTGISVNPDLARRFRTDASRRGISVRALIGALLEVIADDKLVDALLDDGGTIDAR